MRVLKLIVGIPLIIVLSILEIILSVFTMLGTAVTSLIAILMYLMLGVILLFELQPVSEIAIMSLVATGILLSPLVIVGGTALAAGLKQILILWIK